jgi:hypothetical protein
LPSSFDHNIPEVVTDRFLFAGATIQFHTFNLAAFGETKLFVAAG